MQGTVPKVRLVTEERRKERGMSAAGFITRFVRMKIDVHIRSDT